MFGEKAPPSSMRHREMLAITNELCPDYFDPTPEWFYKRMEATEREAADAYVPSTGMGF